MKQIALVILMMSCLASTQAQDVSLKGKWMLGGSIGYASEDNQSRSPTSVGTNDQSNSFTFHPMVGYFINDSWQVGIKGIFAQLNGKSQSIGTIKTSGTSRGVELYLRHYTWMFDHFAFFVEGGARYVKNNQVQENTAPFLIYPPIITRQETGSSQVGVYLQPGFTLLINKRIGVDFTTNLFSIIRDEGDYYDQPSDSRRSYKRFTAQLANFSSLLNNVQIGITLFI
ncbi:MAG TPA: hypothetical protein DCS93_06190 [Microscillaceae bacterium]|nr:hypothetical protein [Microscillaceae bacterium]